MHAESVTSRTIPATERARREIEVREALASVRLEGLEVGVEAESLYARYIEGALSSDEISTAMHALAGRMARGERAPDFYRDNTLPYEIASEILNEVLGRLYARFYALEHADPALAGRVRATAALLRGEQEGLSVDRPDRSREVSARWGAALRDEVLFWDAVGLPDARLG